MDITRHINERENAKNDTGTYIQLAVRLITGILLLVKGFYFVSHSAELEAMVMKTTSMTNVNILVTYIGFAHMFGGAFIILGLLTRFAVILQIPVIIGAVYYNLSQGTLSSGTEIFLSIILLILLVYIFIKGSGKMSMDYYRKRKQL